MSTQNCREYLVNWFESEGFNSVDSDWQEISKVTYSSSYGPQSLREFECSANGLKVFILGDNEDEFALMEAGPLLYDVGQDSAMMTFGAGDYFVICPESFWNRNGYIPDWHTSEILSAISGAPAFWFQEELQENTYALPPGKSIADLHRDFQAAGMKLHDMSLAGQTNKDDDYGELTRSSPPVGSVIKAVLDLFKTDDPAIYDNGEIALGSAFSTVMQSLNRAERETLSSDLAIVLAEYGLPNYENTFYSVDDKENVRQRLVSAALDPNSNTRPGTITDSGLIRDDRPDLDISQMDNHELYRHVLRNEVPQITTIGWCWDDVENRIGPATDDEIAFYCGYLDRNYKLIKDRIIPDDVFERILPEYGKTTWNDYEQEGQTNYHTMPSPAERYVPGVRAHIMGRFGERGFRFDETILSPPPSPLVPVRTTIVEPEIETPLAEESWPEPTNIAVSSGDALQELWHAFKEGNLDPAFGIDTAGFAFTVKEKGVVGFMCGYLDAAGGLVLEYPIPENEIRAIFAEYQIEELSTGSFIVKKMLGQGLDNLQAIIVERLTGIGLADMNGS